MDIQKIVWDVLDSIYDSGLREMAGSCECDKETSSFIKFGKIPCACRKSNQKFSTIQAVAE